MRFSHFSRLVVSFFVLVFLGFMFASPAAGSPIRGVEGDFWADIVIGQPDFSELSPFANVDSKIFVPGGVVADRSVMPNRFYVADMGNSRILGFNSSCLDASGRCSAQLVFGQPDFTRSACNHDGTFQTYPVRAPAGRDSFCGIGYDSIAPGENAPSLSMAVDSIGNLYVPDTFNNRILRYDTPFSTDTLADDVWGQDNFTDYTCNKGRGPGRPSADSLCFEGYVEYWGAAVEVDSEGNLWVGDVRNNRVLRFPIGSKTADLVLGQNDFTGGEPLNTEVNPQLHLDRLYAPSAIRFNSRGWLYVTDTRNHRVLRFKPPFISGMEGELFGRDFRLPSGIEFDPNGEGIWINDTWNGMVELWDEDSQQVKKVLGKPTYKPGSGSSFWWDQRGSMGILSDGSVLALDKGSSDVFLFRNPIPTPGVLIQPNKKLFSPPVGGNLPTGRDMSRAVGVAVSDDQLIVTEMGRLLFWNDYHNLQSYQQADGVVGVPDFQTLDSTQRCCFRTKNDSLHHLYVLFNENGSIPSELKIYQLPLTSYQEPMKTIDLRSIPLLGGGTISVTSIGRVGLAPDPFSRFVWVGDTEHNRILRIRHPLTNPIVDVILGQHDATSYDPNQGLGQPGADTLACPGGITLDRYGNLWISDSNIEICGNVRLLKFNEERFPLDITQPIFAPTADVTLPNLGSYEPGFDSKNRMVLGFNAYAWNGRFPFVYSRPLTSSVSSGQLNDYYQMPFSMSFDEDDNLYIADINRGTVYVYLKPLVDFDYDQGPALTLPPCPDGDLGNLDCDSAGLIDETDLSTLLSSWAPFGPVPTPVGNQHSADISPVGGDGKVDSSDLSALLVHWKVQ